MEQKKIIKEQKGAALVEFGLVLFIVVVLSFIVCEGGLVLYNKNVITNAAREGARAGIVRGDDALSDAEVRNIVINYCNQRLMDFSGSSVTAGDIAMTDRTSSVFGDDFKVSVTYDYGLLVPGLLKFGSTILIHAETLMKMEDVLGGA